MSFKYIQYVPTCPLKNGLKSYDLSGLHLLFRIYLLRYAKTNGNWGIGRLYKFPENPRFPSFPEEGTLNILPALEISGNSIEVILNANSPHNDRDKRKAHESPISMD